MTTESQDILEMLGNELSRWQAQNNLPFECAFEQLMDENVSEELKPWLSSFNTLWDACEELELITDRLTRKESVELSQVEDLISTAQSAPTVSQTVFGTLEDIRSFIYFTAVHNNSLAIEHVPEEHRTLSILQEAIKEEDELETVLSFFTGEDFITLGMAYARKEI